MRARNAAAISALFLLAGSSAAVEVVPRVGVDFEHFGSRYRVTEDRDTVATINDYGTLVGLTVRTPWTSRNRFRLDTDLHVGKETRRLRLDFDGRLERGRDAIEFEQDGAIRVFDEGGAYSISSNYLLEYFRLGWERKIGERWRFRLRESVDLAWYEEPDEYNLNTFVHRPGADLRFRFGDLSDIHVGYQYGRRSVPDSSSLDYSRQTTEANMSLLLGWTTALNVSSQVDRRRYEPTSVRSSSWEVRSDVSFEFGSVERLTYRLVHENEFVRYDIPDELDFDFEWMRTGFQVEVHRTLDLDLSVMPVYAFLTSDAAVSEEYTETGLEVGVDWRPRKGTWISLTNEVGRREYSTPESAASVSLQDFVALEDTAFSDYLYNRLTFMVTADIARTVSLNVFANWQPEDHRVNQHDTETRILSGGLEYRF